MATWSYLAHREQALIELIEAVKLENSMNDNKGINKENYDVWYSIKENAQLLLCELKGKGLSL